MADRRSTRLQPATGEFDSRSALHLIHVVVAQLEERVLAKYEVAGSSPVCRTKVLPMAPERGVCTTSIPPHLTGAS